MDFDEKMIQELVRAAVLRELGITPDTTQERRTLITEQDMLKVTEGGYVRLPVQAILTPLARQVALDRRIHLVEGDTPIPDPAPSASTAIVAIGADHGGYPLKEALKTWLKANGYSVLDMGTHSQEAVDYPDFAHAVAQAVSKGEAWRGILIDGAGIGSAMVANKVPGVRAALCYDQATIVNSREHNDANVLTLGAKMHTPPQANDLVQTWLTTEFGGGRHARRVHKIMAVERQYLRK